MIRQMILFVMAVTIFGECAEATNATKSLVAHCLKETELTQEFLGSINISKEAPEEFYCYLRCIFTGLGLLDQDGVIDEGFFKTMFQEDMGCLKGVSKIVECYDMKAFDECE